MKNNSLKAILFDMDGVVVDSEKLYSQSESNVLSNYGIKFDDSDWKFVKGCTEKQFYDHVYLKYNPQVPRNELIRECREFLKNLFTKKLKYMKGFKEIHSYLKKKFKLALVTSTGPELVAHIDGLLGVINHFNLVITSIDTKAHKPNPDPYIKAMNKLGLLPGECIVVEDSVQGIKAGKAAGCQVIALEGSLEKALLCDADYIISCLSDMQKIV